MSPYDGGMPNRVRTPLALMLAAVVTACAGQSAAQLPLRRLSDDVPPFAKNSGLLDATDLVVRDATEWTAVWSRLHGLRTPPTGPPDIDFRREMVLVTALGQRQSGGSEVEILEVQLEGSTLVAYVLETTPGENCFVTAVLAAPADVAVVPRHDTEVRFERRRFVRMC